MGPVDGDERGHVAGPDPGWEESWSFDFTLPDASLGGYVRLATVASTGRAWFWAAVGGRSRSTVALRDHDVDPPRPGSLEVRAPGLWADLVCESPLDHWSVGLEALAVAYGDPFEAWSSERGDPTALGFDLGWEATAPAVTRAGGSLSGYDQACRVEGEVLVGAERLTIDGWGARSHVWGGGPDWGGADRAGRGSRRAEGVASGRMENGAAFLRAPVEADFDRRGLPVAAGLTLEPGDDRGIPVEAVPVALSPVLIPSGGGPSGLPGGRVLRALCRYRAAEQDLSGAGWAEWLHPSVR